MISKAGDPISGSETIVLYVKYRAAGNTSLPSVQRPALYDPIPKTSVPGTSFTVGMNDLNPCYALPGKLTKTEQWVIGEWETN